MDVSVPDDVQRLAEEVATDCIPFDPMAWKAVKQQVQRAILADRQAREEARDGGGWRVRDLTWDAPTTGPDQYSFIGRDAEGFRAYEIINRDLGWRLLTAWGGSRYLASFDLGANGIAEAKAAAQAHYEARIRSAIEPSPVEGDQHARS